MHKATKVMSCTRHAQGERRREEVRTTEERKKERKKTEGRRESIKAHVHNHHHVPEMGIAWVVCSVARSAVSWVWWHWRVALLVASKAGW